MQLGGFFLGCNIENDQYESIQSLVLLAQTWKGSFLPDRNFGKVKPKSLVMSLIRYVHDKYQYQGVTAGIEPRT
jgi:hypothetical protein